MNWRNKSSPLRICYFGIYRPSAPRDKIYLDGLKRRGAEVLESVDNSPGILKFFRLAKKHRALRGSYNILWVGYLSTMLVPLARLVSDKRIVFNALDSWYDRTILDRQAHSRFSPIAWLIWLFDCLAFRLADAVLVESEAQKIFLSRTFFAKPEKLRVIFTGVDEAIFHPDRSVAKAHDLTVVFRGMFLPATGVEVVLEAAKILKPEGVKFTVIGWGEPLESWVKKKIEKWELANVTLITHFLPPDELRKTMLSAHLMLGQFANHPRLERTIQNKNMEALALGLPLVTRDSESNRELLTDGQNCLFIPPADPKALADAILKLQRDAALRGRLSAHARETYLRKLSPEVLAGQVMSAINSLSF